MASLPRARSHKVICFLLWIWFSSRSASASVINFYTPDVSLSVVFNGGSASRGWTNLAFENVCTSFLFQSLQFLFNYSCIRCLSGSSKDYTVVPLHKSSVPSDIENYSQITLLSSLEKVFKSLVLNRVLLLLLLSSTELFSPNQKILLNIISNVTTLLTL